MFWQNFSLQNVQLGFTDRYSGVSTGVFSQFNLAANVGEDLLTVGYNRGLLKKNLGVRRLFFMKQVHGNDVAVVDSACEESFEIVADGLVTDVEGFGLCVLAADCLPVVFADVENGVVGVAHVGREGMFLGVVFGVVQAMFAKGAKNVQAWLGPAICGMCYEVPLLLQSRVVEKVPASFSVTRWGTSGLDIVSGVCSQLFDLGVEIFNFSVCSFENCRFYSYRRFSNTGRFAGFVSL